MQASSDLDSNLTWSVVQSECLREALCDIDQPLHPASNNLFVHQILSSLNNNERSGNELVERRSPLVEL